MVILICIHIGVPKTYGDPSIAGIEIPTPARNAAHIKKFVAKAVAIPKKQSIKRYIKNAGLRPAPSCM